jgi:hypothetical protein
MCDENPLLAARLPGFVWVNRFSRPNHRFELTTPDVCCWPATANHDHSASRPFGNSRRQPGLPAPLHPGEYVPPQGLSHPGHIPPTAAQKTKA